MFVLAPLALLDVCAKKFGIRTFWHNLALGLPVRATVARILLPRYRLHCLAVTDLGEGR